MLKALSQLFVERRCSLRRCGLKFGRTLADLKSIQPQLVQQLLSRLTSANGPPIRYLLARCLARIYMIGDSSTFGDTLNLCNDTLKIKDDSPSQLPAKLAVLACIAAFYETMGRSVGKPTANARTGPIRPIPLEDALHLLAGGFLRGGIGGFLKGGSNCSTATVGGQKDVRAGIAMGYVEFMREMGATWLERNLAVVCRHLLELAAKCGGIAYTNSPAQAAEAIFLRRCVSYILRATVGTMLSEQAQITACKYLGQLLADYINSFDYSVEPGVERILGAEAYSSAQAAVVATLELSNLVRQIGTAVTPLFVEASGIMEPVFACLLHPIVSARTATAWCLRCITMAVPSQLTPLIDRLEHMKSCSDAISGYSLALAALIAAASDCKLGIPHAKPKQVLTCAEDMLKTATQQSRLAVAKISAGYILLNAVVSMGTPVVKENMPRIIQLWRTAFPRSTKEAEAEKGRDMFHSLLRELVAEITLSDDQGSQMMTTVAGLLCSGAEHTLLAPWSGGATDQALVEDQLQTLSHMGSGALENDSTCLISGSAKDVHNLWPEPDTPQAACLDAAMLAYGRIMLNVLCALALAFRGVSESRGGARMDSEPLRKASTALVESVLETGTTPLVRAVAAEALGRLSQAVGDPQFVALRAQACFDKLRAFRDGRRAGYALALGCIHRHVGSLGSGQHLHTGVSVLFALARDHNAPSVQAWAMVALSLIAETGGGMFRGYVELALSDCLTLLLNTQSSNVEVVQGIGKLLTALMTCVGPELGSCGTIEGVRASLLAACAIQLAHPDPLIKSEAIGGLQQMHLYAPRYVNLGHLVVDIATFLTSQHLCLRKASACCLRQLVQREAREVREHAQVLVPQGVVDEGKKLPLPDTGLEGALFDMLDVETDPTLRAHVQETIISLVQATCSELLNQWLLLCKDILATSNDNTRSTMFVGEEKAGKEGDEDEEGGDDDDATLQVGGSRSAVPDKGKVQPRWPTRVFATQVVQRLMSVCDTERAHLDLSLAKELQMSSGGRADYLVLHLSDLVRMSFMGATSDNTELRLAGLNSLQDVITRFSTVPEPEFPGHVILEQFQAQVGAALRPAFTEDTPSHVTAAACQVCSTWIGSGVARDLNDLRRVHQLLVSSLGKLKHGSINTQLYSESAATLEKLSILKAWAEVYVTAIAQEEHKQNRKESSGDDDDMGYVNSSESLLSLVRPELDSLVCYWLAALRDSALLSLPAQFSDQMPASGGAFYKAESADACREYYRTSWPPILLALAIWLSKSNFELPENAEACSHYRMFAPQTWPDNRRESRFHLMMGIAVEALCSRTTYADDPTIQVVTVNLLELLYN
ncbi:HEAT repeat protein [Ancylostoma ceylanicum]|uniref:HEAT repeat protein n=1 Tax=Ancylostoma ceylanicum TaxID=53326 RepID=A0A0D6LHD3_9BILA|nr:HEAT repeat protein [Ancylostoma ceylanicum]